MNTKDQLESKWGHERQFPEPSMCNYVLKKSTKRNQNMLFFFDYTIARNRWGTVITLFCKWDLSFFVSTVPEDGSSRMIAYGVKAYDDGSEYQHFWIAYSNHMYPLSLQLPNVLNVRLVCRVMVLVRTPDVIPMLRDRFGGVS